MGSARRVQPVPRAFASTTAYCCLVAVLLVVPSGAGAQEEELPEGGPDWVPSIGVGFGIYSRDVTGRIEGVRTGTYFPRFQGQNLAPVTVTKGFVTLTQAEPQSSSSLGNARKCTTNVNTYRAPQPNGLVGICGPFEDVGNESLDGGAPSFHAQLLGPSWRSAPLSPRPFLQGMFALPISSRTIAHDGFKVSDFDTISSEPQVRIEMSAQPKSFWQAGGGVALKLPWERYDVRAKLGLGFSQEQIDVTTKSWVAVRKSTPSICPDDPPIPPGGVNPPIVAPLTEQKNTMNIQSITPSIGLEADVARFGPVMVSVSADTFFSVALSGTDQTFESFDSARKGCNFDGSGTGQVAHSFKADDLQIFGTIGVRFGWVGYGR
jgi:hypothetical protein